MSKFPFSIMKQFWHYDVVLVLRSSLYSFKHGMMEDKIKVPLKQLLSTLESK